jgi:molybdopterin converting factor small subunit
VSNKRAGLPCLTSNPARFLLPVKITVILHTTLQQQTPNGKIGQLVADLPVGGTILDLLFQLGIRLDIDNTLLVVNGRSVEWDQPLADGDQVHLIPAISGG